MRNFWLMASIFSAIACQQERAAVAGSNKNSFARSTHGDPPVAANFKHRPDYRSQYSLIDTSNCRLVEEYVDEGGYWLEICKGPAGWQFERSGSDLREDILLIAPDGRKSELRLTELVADGAFNSLGKTAEWRGTDPKRPEFLIVRLFVARNSEVIRQDVSRLAVIRLEFPACIVAVVEPGPRQNEQARAIADGAMRECVVR